MIEPTTAYAVVDTKWKEYDLNDCFYHPMLAIRQFDISCMSIFLDHKSAMRFKQSGQTKGDKIIKVLITPIK